MDGEKIESAGHFLVALGDQLRVPDLGESEDWDYLEEALADMDEFPSAIVYGHKHRCLVKLPSIYWDLKTVDLLADRLGVRILGPRTVSRAEHGKEFPGVVSRAQRLGPWAVTIVVALVGVGLVVAVGR